MNLSSNSLTPFYFLLYFELNWMNFFSPKSKNEVTNSRTCKVYILYSVHTSHRQHLVQYQVTNFSAILSIEHRFISSMKMGILDFACICPNLSTRENIGELNWTCGKKNIISLQRHRFYSRQSNVINCFIQRRGSVYVRSSPGQNDKTGRFVKPRVDRHCSSVA